MKPLIFLAVFCASVSSLTAASAPDFAPEPVSPRSCRLEERTLPLMEDGQVKFVLYVPGNAKSSLKKAAAEFSTLLSAICGSAVTPVNKLPDDPAVTVLRVGDAAFAESLRIDLAGLDRDGFVIAASGNQILIAGGDAVRDGYEKGTLFGIYDFLERFADARFYFPGKYGTLLPRKTAWRVPAMTIFERPDSPFRKIFWNGLREYKSVFWFDPALKQGPAEEAQRGRLRLSTQTMPMCHGLANMGYVQRFAKSHPEYFAVKIDGTRADGSLVRAHSDAGGHLCFSSGIMEEIYEDTKAVLAGPEAVKARNMTGASRWYIYTKPFFNLMPNDSMVRCRCPQCAPYMEGLNAASGYSKKAADFLWAKLLTIPNRLKEEKIPGYINMMAYDLCREVPDQPIPDNVIIQVASTGPWLEGREDQKKDDERIERWFRAQGNRKIYLWNYPSKLIIPGVPAVPNFTPKAVGNYYKRMYKYSFGTFFEAESDRWFFGHLNFYVMSKVLWDHNADVDAILNEYRERMFGPGSAPMKEIMDTLEELWLKKVFSNMVETSGGPVASPPSEYKLWHDIYSPEVIGKIGKLFDQAEKLAAGDTDARERIRMFRQAVWKPAADAAADYFLKAAAVDYWRAPVKLLAETEKITIDGKGDEVAWKDAPSIALIPLKKDEAEVYTFVKLLADADNFYFLFDCREPMTDKMRQTKRAFDDPDMWADNSVEIHLDTAGKRLEKYQIIVDSLGQVADQRFVSAELKPDWSWNSGAEVRTSVEPGKGWFAEIRVPRKSLPALGGNSFPANFNRHRVLDGVKVHPYYTWSPHVRSFGDLPSFGLLFLGSLPEKNLYTDGDFEVTGIEGADGSSWFHWNDILPARDEKIFRTAGVSLRLEPEGKRTDLVHRVPDLKPDTTYRLSFFIRLQDVQLLPGEKRGGFYVRIDDGNDVVRYYPQNPVTGTIPWTRWEYTFRTGHEKLGTGHKPYHHFTLRNATGKVWLDHVELYEIKTPEK